MPSVRAGCSGLVELVLFSEPVHSPPVAVGVGVVALWSVLVFAQEAPAMSGFTVAPSSSSPHFSPSLVTRGMWPSRRQAHWLFWEEIKRAEWGGRGR